MESARQTRSKATERNDARQLKNGSGMPLSGSVGAGTAEPSQGWRLPERGVPEAGEGEHLPEREEPQAGEEKPAN